MEFTVQRKANVRQMEDFLYAHAAVIMSFVQGSLEEKRWEEDSIFYFTIEMLVLLRGFELTQVQRF
jgi:hypothetical protein